MLIFSGDSNKKLSEKVASALGLSLGNLEIITFPDNENRVRIVDKVLDEDVVIIQSTGILPNLYYMELFLILDGLKRSGARSVTLVMPYIGYQRQDHIFRDGEAVSLEAIITILKSLKVDKLISFDLHSLKIEELFRNENIEISHLSALGLYAGKIREMNISDYTLATPDMGGIRRIKLISEMLGGVKYASIVKNRDLATGSIESGELEGEVGKTVFIIDDVASSCKTLVEAAKLLEEKGAEEIYVFVTHGIFADQGSERLQNSNIKKVFTTDTLQVPEKRKFEKLEILSVSSLIANQLRASSH